MATSTHDSFVPGQDDGWWVGPVTAFQSPPASDFQEVQDLCHQQPPALPTLPRCPRNTVVLNKGGSYFPKEPRKPLST